MIDMIPVVQDITEVDHYNAAMEALGYKAMGEYGISLRRYFQKRLEHSKESLGHNCLAIHHMGPLQYHDLWLSQ